MKKNEQLRNPLASASASSGQLFATFAPLKLRTKLAYGIGHILNDLCASMWFTYLLMYFHLVLKYSNTLAGVILLIGQVADGISTPFVGFESDKTDGFWFCRYGRRKTWHLIGTVCVLVSFPFLFMKCVGCENSHDWAQLIYYAAFVIIFQFGWASVQVSHLSLIPDLTLDTHERTELNAIRYGFTVLSNICVYSITWVIIGINEHSEEIIGPRDADKFRNIVLIVIAIGFVFSVIFHIGVKEPPPHFIESQQGINASLMPNRTMRWKDWFKEPQFYQVALLYMCTRLFVNLSQVYIPMFLQETLHLQESSIAIVPLIMFISGFISSIFMKILNRTAGRKVTYLLGAIGGMAACIWIFFDNGLQVRHIELYVIAALLGLGGSTMLVTSLSITNDLIGSNTESGAFVFGAMSFTDKFSNGITVLLIQTFHPCAECCENCDLYYNYVLSCGCGGAIVLALFALATLAPYEIGQRRREYVQIVGEDVDQTSPLLNSTSSASSYTKNQDRLPSTLVYL